MVSRIIKITIPENFNPINVKNIMNYVVATTKLRVDNVTYFDILMLGIYKLYELGILDKSNVKEVVEYVEKKFFKILRKYPSLP